jgi:hypothetical protein
LELRTANYGLQDENRKYQAEIDSLVQQQKVVKSADSNPFAGVNSLASKVG